jgi:3-hydroxyisobutyrate dehydrogenase
MGRKQQERRRLPDAYAVLKEGSTEMLKVGFIGLGAMGSAMAANLARSGVAVRGFDISASCRDKARASGVEVVAAAPDALEGADLVVTMLPAGKEVLSVWSELLPRAGKETLFIDCSTIDIESARKMHQAALSHGLRSLEAPVSGGVAGAAAGALTFMCGGAIEAFEAAGPVLEKMGRKALHCGGPGLGQAAKLCNNMILGATMIVTCEAFVLGEKLGLSHRALFDAVSSSSGQSWSMTSYCPAPDLTPASPANNGYRPGFAAALMLKDLRLAQQAAVSAGVAAPLGATAERLYESYAAGGGGSADFSGIINMIRGEA